MADTLVLDVPVKQCLRIMAPVRANSMNANGELLNHVVDEVYGVLLSKARIDVQSLIPVALSMMVY
jgi:hypothetical protein